MKCGLCNAKLDEIHGDIDFHSEKLGMDIIVPNIRYTTCLWCGETLLVAGEGNKLVKYVKKTERLRS